MIDYLQLKKLFAEAVELPAGQRSAYVDDVCAGDAELRAELEALLAADEGADDFLEQPVGKLDAIAPTVPSESVIADRYRVGPMTGCGGMGTVFSAVDLRSNERVALKLLRVSGKEHRRRFLREATLLRALSHPGIVRYIDHGLDGSAPFLVMEWLEGRSLRDLLRDHGRLEPQRAALVVRQVAAALAEAHRHGIVHRDIKPSNVFVVDDDLARVSVLDFGVARAVGAAGLTRTGVGIGTPGYMAPEQSTGARDVDARADVYALGHALATLLGRAAAPARRHGDLDERRRPRKTAKGCGRLRADLQRASPRGG